jgi:pyrimidine operon attenuation protein/uracil phosphoribosyltransferase
MPLPSGQAPLVLVDDVVTTGATCASALAALAATGRRCAVLALCAAIEAQERPAAPPLDSTPDPATP